MGTSSLIEGGLEAARESRGLIYLTQLVLTTPVPPRQFLDNSLKEAPRSMMLMWLWLALTEGSWVLHPMLAWGLVPYLVGNLSFWSTVLPLEFVLARVLDAEAREKGPPSLFSWRRWF